MSAEKIWDVAVIGGGIVGLSTALGLQMRGRNVLLLDRGDARARASYGNAGAINPQSILPIASPGIWRNALRYASNTDPALRIRWSALPHFADWLSPFLAACNADSWRRSAAALAPLTAVAYEHHLHLAQRTGAERFIKRNGYLRLYRGDASFGASALEREIYAANNVAVEVLDAAQLRELEPALAPIYTRALFFPESGAADSPGDVVDAYYAAFIGAGGVIERCDVRRIAPGAPLHVSTDGKNFAARDIVIAAGVHSRALLAPFGLRAPLTAERGYHTHFALRPGATLGRQFHDVEAAFVAAPMGGGVRLLSGIELARPHDPPDHRQLDIVKARARAVLPLGAEHEETPWVGSRPSIADGMPVIGRAREHLYVAFGHGHIGFSTGPVTGRIIADLITGVEPPVPIAPFAISRFNRAA